MERGTNRHFTSLVDLASERVGGEVLLASDDFFAAKENLVKAGEPRFLPDEYTDRGKWMDGWESRRRRTSGHDWCVVKLGLPGVVRGVDVDTRHFRGNFPEACALDGALSAEGPWFPLLPRTGLLGDARNLFPVRERRRVTHVRLSIHPDGGIARLRVHGDAAPDARALAAASEPVDLAALANGGLVLAVSDAFFGPGHALLAPGRPAGMHDGWETRRSRRDGFDEAIVRLGARGVVREAEVDTTHFKGNFPASCSIDVCDAPGADLESLRDPALSWRPLLGETPLAGDAVRAFSAELREAGPATHARLRIHPDGGVARLRLWGRPVAPAALAALDRTGADEAAATLLRCCGSSRWASAVAAGRPFAGHLALFAAAEDAFEDLGEEDWLEAFHAHPRIGDRAALAARFAATRAWAEGEQAAALGAPDDLLDALAAGNEEYERRFGFLFVVCAAGQPAWRMLASLRDRLGNPRDLEVRIAADEQRRITRRRLAKLLAEEPS